MPLVQRHLLYLTIGRIRPAAAAEAATQPPIARCSSVRDDLHENAAARKQSGEHDPKQEYEQ